MVCSYGFGLWMQMPGNGQGAGRFSMLLWACALLGLIPLVQALLLPEVRRADDAERFRWSALKVLVRPRSLLLLTYGGLYAMIANGVEINLSPFYHAIGFDEGEIGSFAALRYVGRALGGVVLTLAAVRLGRRGVLVVAVLALAVTTAGQAWIAGPFGAGLGALVFGAANGWADALFFVLAMEASDPRMAASTYSLFMAVTNVSVAGGSLFARLDTALGGRYRPTFLASGLMTLAALLLVPPLSRPARASGGGCRLEGDG
jgi:MFS transporter, PAT family, beta-lactamase induction signal transducer AmpG